MSSSTANAAGLSIESCKSPSHPRRHISNAPYARDVGARRRATGLTIGLTAIIAVPQTLAAGEDDVPKREPVLAWEVPVDCDSDAEITSRRQPGRQCALAFGQDLVYLHQHPGSAGGEGDFRLSAYDLATGVPTWAEDVGETSEIRATDEAVILSDKTHIEVFDGATGERRFTRAGALVDYNRYGVIVMQAAADSITGVDAVDGAELWSTPGQVGAMCRDFVAVVPAPSQPAAPFKVIDHRSGELRWQSESDFDPRTDSITCSGAPWIYVSNGERLYEMDAYDGWTTWETAIPGADEINLYREVALVETGPAGETVTAVRREDGAVLWQAPSASVGSSLSWVGRLREDATGLFTLHPLTGETVRRIDLAASGGAPFHVVGVSDTRVVVAVGTTITAFGMNDLGMAWQLDVGSVPDDFGVANGYLVVRLGRLLRGYAATLPPH